MTEEEAKTKWCPFSRSIAVLGSADGDVMPVAGAYPHNRIHPPREKEPIWHDTAHACVASECMAWRWHEAKRTEAFVAAVQVHMKRQTRPNYQAAMQEVFAERGDTFQRSEGFCGLAGQP